MKLLHKALQTLSSAGRLIWHCLRLLPFAFAMGMVSWATIVLGNSALHEYSHFNATLDLSASFLISFLTIVTLNLAVFVDPRSPDPFVIEKISAVDGSENAAEHSFSRPGPARKEFLYLRQGMADFNWSIVKQENQCGRRHSNDLECQRDTELSTVLVKHDGSQRFCRKCNSFKPDRSHHCSACGRCILKMDHHCVWLGSCVGLGNHRYFIQFLMYVTLLCLWTAAHFIPLVIEYFRTSIATDTGDNSIDEETSMAIQRLLLSVFAVLFGLILGSFLGFHIYLILENLTTIESMERSRYRKPNQKRSELQDTLINPQDTYFQQDTPNQPLDKTTHQRDVHLQQRVLEGETVLLQKNSNPFNDDLRDDEPVVRIADNEGIGMPNRFSIDSNRTIQSSEEIAAGTFIPYTDGTDGRRESRAQKHLASVHERHDQGARLRRRSLEADDRKQFGNVFDIGWRRNWKQAMGSRMIMWFLPIGRLDSDGYSWPINRDTIQLMRAAERDRQISRDIDHQNRIASHGSERHYAQFGKSLNLRDLQRDYELLAYHVSDDENDNDNGSLSDNRIYSRGDNRSENLGDSGGLKSEKAARSMFTIM